MRFLAITLIVHAPNPVTGELSLLDPVRAFEDYATLDHLSGGRLELIIGKGNGTAQRDLFHVTPEDQWDRNAESYELFRQIWRDDRVSAAPRFRPELLDAEVWPRPLQQPIRVWHGSATSRESVDLAARYGDPLFSANVTNPIEPYAELVRYYRERWLQSPAAGHREGAPLPPEFGHTVMHLHADAGGLSEKQHHESLELFQSDIAPVLRREIPDPPWGWGPVAAGPARRRLAATV